MQTGQIYLVGCSLIQPHTDLSAEFLHEKLTQLSLMVITCDVTRKVAHINTYFCPYELPFV